jgi:hypothetical protein
MLFLELVMFHKERDIILKSDDQLSPLIYQILQNNADTVEIIHSREWDTYEITTHHSNKKERKDTKEKTFLNEK